MWVVVVPPTDSLPTTEGLLNQCSGWIPSLPRTPVPEPPPGEAVSPAKLDSSFWKVAAGIW